MNDPKLLIALCSLSSFIRYITFDCSPPPSTNRLFLYCITRKIPNFNPPILTKFALKIKNFSIKYNISHLLSPPPSFALGNKRSHPYHNLKNLYSKFKALIPFCNQTAYKSTFHNFIAIPSKFQSLTHWKLIRINVTFMTQLKNDELKS